MNAKLRADLLRIYSLTFVNKDRTACFDREIRNKRKAVDKKQKKAGVKKDIIVQLGFPQKKTEQVQARIIFYKDPTSKKFLKFLTNDLESKANKIAELYAKRWNIELLFKRLKQNMPLQYFLGDNQNAIRMQIYCALIADLLLNVIESRLSEVGPFPPS